MQVVGVAAFAVLVSGAPFRAFPVRLFVVSALASIVAGAACLCAQTAHIGGQAIPSLDLLATMALRTEYGHVCIARMALLVLAVGVVVGAAPDAVPARRMWLAFGAAVAALATVAITGHASAAGPDQWPIAAIYVVHLVASAVWLGGLLPFAVALHGARRADKDGIIAAVDIARRFSTLGLVAVVALVASGLVNAAFTVGRFTALLTDPYGILLSAKLALFAAMLTFAAVNRCVLLPQLVTGDRPARASRRLARNAALELALGIAVVVVAVQLGAAPPPGAP